MAPTSLTTATGSRRRYRRTHLGRGLYTSAWNLASSSVKGQMLSFLSSGQDEDVLPSPASLSDSAEAVSALAASSALLKGRRGKATEDAVAFFASIVAIVFLAAAIY